jgi:hypothetical protein
MMYSVISPVTLKNVALKIFEHLPLSRGKIVEIQMTV